MRSFEAVPDASTPGSVVAEIGADHGAVVVHVPRDWHGREIEVRHAGERWAGIHVAVLARQLVQHDEYSAFFPSLREGVYRVRLRPTFGTSGGAADPPDVRTVRVLGGDVANLYWGVPAPSCAPSEGSHHACPRPVAGDE
jgi:hypothetical protein